MPTTSRVKDLRKQFETGTSPKQLVENTLHGSKKGSYLYGGKTSEAQQTTTPLVVLARPGAYNMVCNEDACYIRIPHGQARELTSNNPKNRSSRTQ